MATLSCSTNLPPITVGGIDIAATTAANVKFSVPDDIADEVKRILEQTPGRTVTIHSRAHLWDGATISVAAETSDTRLATVTLTKDGTAITSLVAAFIYVTTSSTGSVGASSATLDGASAIIDAAAVGKHFLCSTAGVVSVTIADEGTESVYLVVVLPSGGLVVSSAIAFA